MTEEKFAIFQNRLTKVNRHRSKLAKKAGITCFRLYDHDIPEFPFSIERYEQNVYVAEYKRRHGMSEEAHEAWISQCISIISDVLSIPPSKVFSRIRQRKAGRDAQYQKLQETKAEFIVVENGIKFIVNLSDYLDSGLFLDHRITREMIKKEAANKDFLNLFCYTGSFSVYAAGGHAKSVTSVDLSRTYLEWAQRNMEVNAFVNPGFHFIQADILQWLPAQSPETYDLILMDPPTFSNSKRMEAFLDIQRDHVMLINHCIRILRPQGVLYFSTNFSKFKIDESNIRATEMIDITKQTTPFDFEGKLARCCYRIKK